MSTKTLAQVHAEYEAQFPGFIARNQVTRAIARAIARDSFTERGQFRALDFALACDEHRVRCDTPLDGKDSASRTKLAQYIARNGAQL